MRLPTPENIKSAVIDAWLMGKTRDKIASEFNTSTGSVSNIIAEWQNRIGVYDANSLRKLGLALKNGEITPLQCAKGLRIHNILNHQGIDEDHVYDFLKLFNECQEQRSTPAALGRIIEVVDAYPEGVTALNELPKYIDKRRQEQTRLDIDIYNKKHEIENLDQEIDRRKKEIQDLKDDFESCRKEMQNEKKDFLLFKEVKEELKKNDIDICVLEPLRDVIKIFREKGFLPLKILSEYSDINAYRDLVENKHRNIQELESHIQDLKTISENYEAKIDSNEKMVQSLIQLERLGVNASHIKKLDRTISDISTKYSLHKNEITSLFFRYIDRLNSLLTIEQDILEKTMELNNSGATFDYISDYLDRNYGFAHSNR